MAYYGGEVQHGPVSVSADVARVRTLETQTSTQFIHFSGSSVMVKIPPPTSMFSQLARNLNPNTIFLTMSSKVFLRDHCSGQTPV